MAQGSTFEPNEALNVNRTGGGQVLLSSSGERLWTGQVTFGLTQEVERRRAQAVLNAVRRPGMPFLCYDRKRAFPLADPGGFILAGSNVNVLSASENDLSSLSLQGLPAGYVLTPGDMIGYRFGFSPVRYFLHELVEGAVADSAGRIPLVQITPFRSHALPGTTVVSLIRPRMVAKYDPDSFSPGTGRSGGVEGGRAFRFIQTMEN